MRLGFLQAYNEINWIKYSIQHAMKFCNKLVIIEGSQFTDFKEIPLHSTDGTLEIIEEMMEEYPKDIELTTTIRKYLNYRENQAANFNLALKRCKNGDYFLPLDADEFYFDDFIKKIIDITDDGDIDYLQGSGPNFAFSFNWRLIMSTADYYYPQVLFKKNRKLKFVKTHNPKNYGHNYVFDKSGTCLNHYKWIRPNERMLIRHKTSGFYKNMLEWFNQNWFNIELVENKKYEYYGGDFHLQKYDGPHPKILDKHPWRSLEDIRKV